MADDTVMLIIMVILCFFLPPLAVYLKRKSCDMELILNIVLIFLFWFPATIHSLLVVLMDFSICGNAKIPGVQG